MQITLQTIPQIKARIPSSSPSPEVTRLLYPIDLSNEGAVNDAQTLASWAIRLKDRLDDKIQSREPGVKDQILEAAFPILLRELITDDARRHEVEQLIEPLESQLHTRKMEVFRCKQTQSIAKQVEATVKYYLENEKLQQIPLAREIIERIISDFEFLVEDPVNNMYPYYLGEKTETTRDHSNTKITQTREFILTSLDTLIKERADGTSDAMAKYMATQAAKFEIAKWLYRTYTEYDIDSDYCIRDHQLREDLKKMYPKQEHLLLID